MGDTIIPEGWELGHRDGYYSKTFQVGNCTATVHRPILDNEERLRREEAVRQALTHMGGVVYRG